MGIPTLGGASSRYQQHAVITGARLQPPPADPQAYYNEAQTDRIDYENSKSDQNKQTTENHGGQNRETRDKSVRRYAAIQETSPTKGKMSYTEQRHGGGRLKYDRMFKGRKQQRGRSTTR